MRAEIRERLAEKIPLAPASVSPNTKILSVGLGDIGAFTRELVASLPQPTIKPPALTSDNRMYLKLRIGDGETEIQIPENVAHTYRSRYGRAPGFEKWFLERVRDLLNAS